MSKLAEITIKSILRGAWLCGSRCRMLRERERWDGPQMRAFQAARLRESLQCAIAKIPAYARVRPIRDGEDVFAYLGDAFPVVSKADLLRDRQAFYPHGGRVFPWSIRGKTSGTTGSPLDVFRSMDSVLWENAFIHRHWQWSGFQEGMRRATLRGDAIIPLGRQVAPFWLENRVEHQLLLSTRHLNPATAGGFADALEAYQPYLLQAYPSAAFVLAQALERADRKLSVPWVFTGSEMLYAYQRELIEARIGRVMDFYGMAERVAFASECEHGNLHVNTDYSYVEILDENDQPTLGEGVVVGTTFHNHLMPLVRYRLSDRTRWKAGVCQCGRPYPMIEPIAGKFEDVVYGSAGNVVSPSIITFAFKGVSHIEASQVAQVAPGRWEIRIVPGKAYSEADGRLLLHNIHALVDAQVEANLVVVHELGRTAAGKFRWVVNETEIHNEYDKVSHV